MTILRGGGTGGVVRLVVAMGTLLGPEETNTRVGVPLWGAGGGFFQGRLAGVSWSMALPGATW